MNMSFSRSLDNNPIEQQARRAFGAPKTVKGYLAAQQNPRPAALVLMTTAPITSPMPWHSISDDQWAQEMRGNNGNLISILLRHPRISGNAGFLALFDRCEIEYQACLKRLDWGSKGPDQSVFTSKVLNRMEPVFEELVEAFVSWATEHREAVWAALEEIAQGEEYQSGNAMTDLKRLDVDWV